MGVNSIRLIVSMPGKIVMDESVGMVILTAASGNFGVLPGHEPASIALREGMLCVRRSKGGGGGEGSGGGGSVSGGSSSGGGSGSDGGGNNGSGGGGGYDGGGSGGSSDGKLESALMVMGGYATVRDDTVNVMTPVADTPERIDHAIESIIQEREHNKKYEQTANLEANRAEMALRNILLRRGDSMLAYPMSHIGNDEYND